MSVNTKSRSNPHENRSTIRQTRTLGKGLLKKVIDLILYVLFCAMVGTGMLLSYRLPHGDGSSRTLFLGFGRHEWGEIHTWIGLSSVGLLVVHLFLNWQWLVKVAASKHIWRLVAGILTGLLVVGAFLLLPVERAERNRESDAIHLESKQ
jgi:hypothetical protein